MSSVYSGVFVQHGQQVQQVDLAAFHLLDKQRNIVLSLFWSCCRARSQQVQQVDLAAFHLLDKETLSSVYFEVVVETVPGW